MKEFEKITDRLLLRPLQLSDTSAFYSYRSDAETNKYQGWIPSSIEEAKSFIENLPKQINIPDTWFQLAMLSKENNTMIGDIGIHFIGPDNQQVELGSTLNKNYHGKGYASEALSSIIGFLFTELNKHRIIASLDPQNISSIRLVERLGFRKEAHFRESLFLNGTWVDDLVYAMLKKDWNP